MSDPSSTDPVRWTAAEMAAALAGGDLSAVELTRAHLERIGQVDGTAEAGVHAFLHAGCDLLALLSEALAEARRP